MMRRLLILLSVMLVAVSGQYEYAEDYGNMRFGRPPRMYMIGGELGYMGRRLPHIIYGGAMTAPPEVSAVQGRIFTR